MKMFVIELVNIKPETIYTTHPTIITTPSPFMSKYYFDTKIQAIFSRYDKRFEK